MPGVHAVQIGGGGGIPDWQVEFDDLRCRPLVFCADRPAQIGKIGEYYRRVFWRRMGMTLKLRDRVYELSGTDPVKISIMGAELILSPTNA
jgi:hypothetical protein